MASLWPAPWWCWFLLILGTIVCSLAATRVTAMGHSPCRTQCPGDYQLIAIDKGWELDWMNPEVLNKFRAAAVAVQVQPNGKYKFTASVQ
jgi:hypothetical protein